MKNKFRVNSCCYCRAAVEPGAGRVWKWNGRWYGCHAGCTKANRVERTNVVELAERAARRAATPADADAAAEWAVDAERAERESEDFMERETARVTRF